MVPQIEDMVSKEILATLPPGTNLSILEAEIPDEHIQSMATEIKKGALFSNATTENGAPLRLQVLGIHPSDTKGSYYLAVTVCAVVQ